MQLSAEQEERNTREISVYKDNKAEVKLIATELRKLKAVFPSIEIEFINVLAERVLANNFTEHRIKDAIGNLIDNFRYTKPTVADIIGFDKRVKIFSYSEYCNEILSKKASGEDFIKHWIEDTLFWVKRSECVRYNFKPNQTKVP